MIYSEVERKEIERVYGVFKDYIHASKFLDFVWSEKLGYLLLFGKKVQFQISKTNSSPRNDMPPI